MRPASPGTNQHQHQHRIQPNRLCLWHLPAQHLPAHLVGLAKAQGLAARHGVTIHTDVADLATYDLGAERWDAILSLWCHTPSALRAGLHRRAIEALRPGGVLLLEAYTPEQLAAWAPQDYDTVQWARRMQANQPFIAQAPDTGAVAGFADLQASGYIDQFFVAPAFAGQGVARALMGHIHAQAAQRGIAQLHADVSLTAEPFFAACGFVVQARQQAQRQGVVLHNARMVKVLIM